MTSIDIAHIVHDANRAYCRTIGDDTQPLWEDAPDWQRTSAVTGVDGILAGTITRPAQAHEAWLAEKQATGWQYGPVKNPAAREHPCVVPYAELPREQQTKDTLFFAIVRACQGQA